MAPSMAPGSIALPYLSLNPLWMQEAGFFASENPAVVRAGFQMLVAAWRNAPCASVLPDHKSIARITGLAESEVIENMDVLSDGWDLVDGRLVHLGMQELFDSMFAKNGEALAEIGSRAASIAQSPDDFDLIAQVDAPTHGNKGKRALPKGWQPDETTRKHLAAKGYVSEEDIQDLVQVMSDWAASKGERRTDWNATLRGFATKTPRTTAILPFVQPSMDRFSAFTRKESVLNHNHSVLDRARQRGG